MNGRCDQRTLFRLLNDAADTDSRLFCCQKLTLALEVGLKTEGLTCWAIEGLNLAITLRRNRSWGRSCRTDYRTSYNFV